MKRKFELNSLGFYNCVKCIWEREGELHMKIRDESWKIWTSQIFV